MRLLAHVAKQLLWSVCEVLLRYSALYVLARGIPGLINLFALSIFTRVLVPEEYGIYAATVAWVSLANSLLFPWLKLGLGRFLPAFETRRKELMSTILVSFIALLPLSAIPWVLIHKLFPDQIPLNILPIAVLLLWAEAWFELNLELNRTELRPLWYGLMSSFKAILALSLGVLGAYIGAVGLLIALVLAYSSPSLLMNWSTWKKSGIRDFQPDIFQQLMRYGLPLTGSFALNFIISSSDRILIKHFLGDEAVGHYAVGYDLAQQTLTVIFMMVNLAARPLIIRAYEHEGDASAQIQFGQFGRILFFVTVPAAIGLYVVAGPLIRLVVGADFQEYTARVFSWIVLGAFLHGVKTYYVDEAFHLSKSTSMQLWTVIPSALINIAWNVAFIPQHGLIAAAHSTVASYAIGLVSSFILVRKRLGISVSAEGFLPAAVISLFMGACVFEVGKMTKGNLVAMILTGLVVYAIPTLAVHYRYAKDLRKVGRT